MDFTIQQFDLSNCGSYSIENLIKLAKQLKIPINKNENAARMCLKIRTALPSDYTEYNGIYYLDPNKMAKVLNTLSPEEREIYQFVWNHTKFIPTQQVLDFVSLAIDDFLSSVEDSSNKTVMLSPSQKWGSEQWLATVFYDKLGQPPVTDTLTSLSPGSYNIIILDDAVYSGTNLISTIDEGTYDLAKKYGLKQKQLSKNGFNLTFYIIVGLASNYGMFQINNFLSGQQINFHVSIGARMKTITDIVEEEKFNMKWQVYNDIVEKQKYPSPIDSKQPLYDATTVWLGHKIANLHGTTEKFIRSVLLNDPSRKVVEEAEQLKDKFKKY